jgi:hypothetical protein
MEIIQRRETVEYAEYRLAWDELGQPGSGAGYSFPCDAQGVVDTATLAREAAENLRKCQAGELPVRFKGIESFTVSYTQPTVGLCDCGQKVELDGFTNTCEGCGTDYNWAGQQLAPRQFWGEETGEDLSDILRIK